MRIKLAGLAAVCAVAVVLVAVAAAQVARPGTSGTNVRILGRFLMSGTVTVAVGIPGERHGERLARTWRIRPFDCAESYCPRIVLVRNRGAQRESKLTLHRIGASTYRGTGTFWVPLACLGRTYAHGSLAPYVITLRVSDFAPRGAIRYATALTATYTNAERSDRTHCPLGVVHDAAHYTGQLKSALPPEPATTTTPTASVPTTPAPAPTPTTATTTDTATVPLPTPL